METIINEPFRDVIDADVGRLFHRTQIQDALVSNPTWLS